MRLKGWIGAIGLLLATLVTPAKAQGVFGGGSTAFDPEIRVVNSGALLDAQAVVSHDRKYVTITARPSVSQLISLQQFPIVIPANLGFVGSTAIQQLARRERGDTSNTPVLPTPSLLDKRGMTKLD